ncbi:MAG: EamA family transporter [Candidatus Cryptobacteroides sp.]
MWLSLAFISALMLGLYDSLKKESLSGNAVIPILFLNTLFCSLIFLPFILLSNFGTALDGSIFKVAPGWIWSQQKWVILKSVLVLGSWLLGYFAMKHLPLTIVGPVNATRPVMVLVGAMIVFGERLNACQWAGVVLAVVSFLMLGRSSKKEGIDFKHDVWIYALVGAAVLGAASGLYDKFLMNPDGLALDKMMVQGWYNLYQCAMMGIVLLLLWFPSRRRTTPFRWKWSIPFISIFLSIADFVYFYALSLPGAMISIVSMVRRGSVIVSFLFGALVFREKNLRSKAVDLLLVLLGMLFLYLGSK